MFKIIYQIYINHQIRHILIPVTGLHIIKLCKFPKDISKRLGEVQIYHHIKSSFESIISYSKFL